MKISRFNRVIGIFFALMVTVGVAVSSNNLDGKNRNIASQESCIQSISGLSEYQKGKITSMEIKNQSAINDLQEKRRSAVGKTQKDEIRKQMDKQIESHGNAIKTLLSADQQKQYIQFQSNEGNQNFQGQKQGAGKGNGRVNSSNGRGNGSGSGRGNGKNCRI